MAATSIAAPTVLKGIFNKEDSAIALPNGSKKASPLEDINCFFATSPAPSGRSFTLVVKTLPVPLSKGFATPAMPAPRIAPSIPNTPRLDKRAKAFSLFVKFSSSGLPTE